MMVVPTYVGPSRIEGVGIFAGSKISQGDVIWVLDEQFDLLVPEGVLQELSDLQRTFFDRYTYPHKYKPGFLVLEFDHGRFMNHSPAPNTDFTTWDTAWAIRDIDEGEEITCNYAEFDSTFVSYSSGWAEAAKFPNSKPQLENPANCN